MEEKQINPAESLDIINSMITRAKNSIADDGFYFILWGWLIFIASMASYCFTTMNWENGGYIWTILLPLGGIASIVYSKVTSKKETVRTYTEIYLGYCWIACGAAMAVSLAFMSVHSMPTTYFFLMLIYGTATLISGGLMNFKPLIYGSTLSYIFAIVSVYAGEKEQFLCLSASLLCSYIIPGHMLKAKYQSQEHV